MTNRKIYTLIAAALAVFWSAVGALIWWVLP